VSSKSINVGGTPGGLGEFLIGLVLMIVGFYMIFTNTVVFTSFWHFHGYNLLGPLIIVFMIGLVFLCINGRSWIGGTLCCAAILALTVGIIMHLRFHFRSMTLLSALVMFGLPAVGFGLIVRALQAHGRVVEEAPQNPLRR
jgi:hypothetical protein